MDETANIVFKVEKLSTSPTEEICCKNSKVMLKETINVVINNDFCVNESEEIQNINPNEIFNSVESMEKAAEEQTFNECIESENKMSEENAYFSTDKILELARFSWNSDSEKQIFTKGCFWSKDGTCVLIPTNLDGMHVMELPTDLYDNNNKISHTRPVTSLKTVVHVQEGGTIYDVDWYPFMNSSIPESCCWLATRQHEPVHLWDAFNGDLRCTYKGYNAVDEIESAIAVKFSNDGERVIGGYKTAIRIFNTDIPGRKCQTIPNKTAASCFATNSNNNDIIAVGNWNGIIKIFDIRAPQLGCLSSLFGHLTGVTHLKFSEDGNSLFSGVRKNNNIFQWDMRNFTEPIKVLHRNSLTNQRIYFDLSPNCNCLASGDKNGILHVWNSQDDFEKEIQFRLHEDSTNGVNFHPTMPVLATSSGQYHFIDTQLSEITYENSLILWWIACIE